MLWPASPYVVKGAGTIFWMKTGTECTVLTAALEGNNLFWF